MYFMFKNLSYGKKFGIALVLLFISFALLYRSDRHAPIPNRVDQLYSYFGACLLLISTTLSG